MSRKIAVAGGGAAGMAAAIQAARMGAQVTIYERNDRIGKKILSTGNGKCNFSNDKMGVEFYYGSGIKHADAIYKTIGTPETRQFFEALGMRIKEKNGYLYPASEQASTVLDVLRYELERLKVSVHTNSQVIGIKKYKGRFAVETAEEGKEDCYDAVILSCGGKAAPKTGSDGSGFALAKKLGHKIIPVVPALTALKCKEDFCKRVAGVRCDARLTLMTQGQAVRTERGELQWTDYGISGIPVFQLSRMAAYALQEEKHTTVDINFLPDYTESKSDGCDCSFWTDRWIKQGGQTMEQFVTGIVNKKIGLTLLKLAGIKEQVMAQDVPVSHRKKLEKLYSCLTVTVKGTNSFEQAQVCAGGVDCAQVTENLESRIIPGLYFAGEILDIDGICGGYNLQWAWSSGMMAGKAAAAGLL